MALTDSNEAFAFPDISRAAQSQSPQPQAALPRAALSRLPELHAETADTRRLATFLATAVQGAAVLMLMGVAAAATASVLATAFAWSLLVLIGVGAMLHSYIKSTAAVFDRAPLTEAAKDLRAILLYAGFAWGAGSFLILPATAAPAALLAFTLLPATVMAWLTRDRDGALAFLIPVTLLGLAAVLLRPVPAKLAAGTLLIVFAAGLAAVIFRRAARHRAPGAPAGLSLR